jgi:hypothetical protein
LANRSIPGAYKSKGAKSVAAYRRAKKPKFAIRGGEGYGTNREGSTYKFDITIEHGDLDIKLAMAQREIKRFAEGAARELAGKPSGLTSFDNANSPFKIDLEAMAFKFTPEIKSDKLNKAIYDDLAADIGLMAKEEIRWGIQHPEGRPRSFRYETGMMYNSVDYRKFKNVHSTRISIGWVDTFYKYFDFQESRTFDVGPMNAVRRGFRSSIPKSYALASRFLANFNNTTGFSGRYQK